MTQEQIDQLVVGKDYQFVAILGAGDYPAGGVGTLLAAGDEGIALKLEFVPEGGLDAEWSLREVLVPKNKMQWMRRLTTDMPPRKVVS